MGPYPIKTSIALLTAFIAAGLGLMGCESRKQPVTAPSKPEVAVMEVQPERVVLSTELPGRTSAFRMAEIRPQVSGLLEERLFAEGADVKAGDLLYRIDAAPFQAALDNAEANVLASQKAADRARASLSVSLAGVSRSRATLELAKTNYRRLEKLLKDRAVSQSDYDRSATEAAVAKASLDAAEAQVQSNRVAVAEAEAAIEQAQAALKTAKINLGYTRITAPISGRIGRSAVTEGAILTAYQPLALATIQQLDPMHVDVPQSTSDLIRLKKRIEEGRLNRGAARLQKVGLLLEDGTRYPYEGTFQFQDVTVDPSTGSVILRIVFPNPKDDLLPGMFVRAVIQEGVNESAILVPQQAVFRDPKGNPVVMVVDNANRVDQRSLTVDRAIRDRWLVSEGLSAGDRVVVEGLQKVRAGMTVDTVAFEETDRPKAGA